MNMLKHVLVQLYFVLRVLRHHLQNIFEILTYCFKKRNILGVQRAGKKVKMYTRGHLRLLKCPPKCLIFGVLHFIINIK